NQGGHVTPVEMPVGERADEIVKRTGAVPVALAMIRRLDLCHPVDELQAVRAGGADRIDHHLPMRQPTGAHHARGRQHRLKAPYPAPDVNAGVARLALVGKELLADDGMDAIARDRDAATHGEAVSAAGSVGERNGDAVFVLLDTEAMTVGDNAIVTGAQA